MAQLKLCLDTNLLIAYLRGREPEATIVEMAVNNYAFQVTVITVYELLFGVARSQKHIGETALLGVLNVLPLNDVAARRAAYLHAEWIGANQDIGVKDVLIAAKL